MADLTIQQKKDWAKLLYTREQLQQKEISERVGVSSQTMCKWVKDGHWDDLKVSITITKEEQIKNLYRQLSEINQAITMRDPGKRFATPAESDTINKLAGSIDKMESDIGLADIISTVRRFLDWLRKTDLKQAQGLTPLFDAFIKDMIR